SGTMNVLQFSAFVLLIVAFEINQVSARYVRTGYVSDPVELLLQDAYSSLRNREYMPIKRPYRQIQKRRYSAFPPSFYSTFGFGDMPTSQRHVLLPYTDLLFNGR
uniref:Short neuropeptide F n=1 Tax=Haemonchus contortus TaxID=6289 RepID=A0A7I4XV96_HAECO